MTKIAIFDYGAGNIFSLKNSLQRQGASVDVIRDFTYDSNDNDNTNNYDDTSVTYERSVKKFDGLLLPGVGNFDPAMNAISRDDLIKYVDDTIPVFGICLGMEMFFAKSQEGTQRGLCILDGEVVSLPDTIKVPHMGWNNLHIRRDDSQLLDGINDDSWVYFVHSYMAKPLVPSSNIITSESDYNGISIPASIEYKNYFGTQFHPEKSGLVGRQMISNFLKVCRR